jgi:hypothetical protein
MEWINQAQDIGPVTSSCEHGAEQSGSINCWDILEQISDWPLLKMGSAPCSSIHKADVSTCNQTPQGPSMGAQ